MNRQQSTERTPVQAVTNAQAQYDQAWRARSSVGERSLSHPGCPSRWDWTRTSKGPLLTPLLKDDAPRDQAVVAAQAPLHVFDEPPPELADLSPASLKEIFAGRRDAQGDKFMEQHVDKSVRVSGEVARV
jgi:hypothetical protein